MRVSTCAMYLLAGVMVRGYILNCRLILVFVCFSIKCLLILVFACFSFVFRLFPGKLLRSVCGELMLSVLDSHMIVSASVG